MRRSGAVALIVSPAAEHAADVPNFLRAAGISIGEQIAVRDLEAMRPRGTAWRRRGYVAAVAAGGDGTVGAAVSQLAESGLSLGILPLGTSNDIARSLGIPLDLAAACAVIANGIDTPIDVGIVIPTGESSEAEPGHALFNSLRDTMRGVAHHLLPPGSLRDAVAGMGSPELRFLHAVTLGLNVEFARLATDIARRKRWGPLNYAAASVEALLKVHPVSVTLRLSGSHPSMSHPGKREQAGLDRLRYGRHQRVKDERTVTYEAVQVAVVNTPVFGGALNMRLPAADPADRLLDVVVIEALEPHRLRETVNGLLAALSTLPGSILPTSLAPQPFRPSVQSLSRPDPEREQTAESAESAANALLLTEEAARFALPGVRHYQARSVFIDAPAGVEMSLDGEISARTPAEICLAGKQLHVLLPAEAHLAVSAASTASIPQG